MERLNDGELVLMILGDVYRALKCADRLPEDILACTSLEWRTGLPTSANDLKLGGAVTLYGEGLVREAFWSPDQIAMAHIRRSCDACERCSSGDRDRCERGPLLSRCKKETWSKDEVDAYRDLRQRVQSVFRKWETSGVVDRTPPILFTGDPVYERAREHKDTWAARFTEAGIDLAKRVIPGTPYASGPKSLLDGMTDEQKRNAPQWAQKEHIAEGGRIAGPPLVIPFVPKPRKDPDAT